MNNLILQIVEESIQAKQRLLSSTDLIQKIEQATMEIMEAFKTGHRLYFCGNGGSAADAQHLAAEFSGSFYNRSRPALAADALHCNTSYLTAVANDFDYNTIYARLVQGIMTPGDILIGLSTSGNSANILEAFKAARAKGIRTIAMTGEGGGAVKPLADILFNVPSTNTPRIQECHMLIGHTICQLVEQNLFGEA